MNLNPFRWKSLGAFSMSSRVECLAIAFFSVALAGSASAATAHDEGVNGDLSTDPNNPTPVSFSLGSNVVTGTMVT